MSSELSMAFGSENGEVYGEVLQKWSKKLKGVTKITEPMKQEWAADLRDALSEKIVEKLESEAILQWKKVGELPSKETIHRYAQIAAKASLSNDQFDLLDRLPAMVKETQEAAKNPDAVTAAIQVGEALKRVGQTTAQIFDMVKDKFNTIIEKVFRRNGDLTGRRRWRTVADKSRHASLNYQIKTEGQEFHHKGQSFFGPRPPGGDPATWSNCSCYLQREKSNGDWVTMR